MKDRRPFKVQPVYETGHDKHAFYARGALLWITKLNLTVHPLDRFILASKMYCLGEDDIIKQWHQAGLPGPRTRQGINVRYQTVMRKVLLQAPEFLAAVGDTFDPLDRYIRKKKSIANEKKRYALKAKLDAEGDRYVW